MMMNREFNEFDIKLDVRLLLSLPFKSCWRAPVLSQSSISSSWLGHLSYIRSSKTPRYCPKRKPCRIWSSSLRFREWQPWCGWSSSPKRTSSSIVPFYSLTPSRQVPFRFCPKQSVCAGSFCPGRPIPSGQSKHKLHWSPASDNIW